MSRYGLAGSLEHQPKKRWAYVLWALFLLDYAWVVLISASSVFFLGPMFCIVLNEEKVYIFVSVVLFWAIWKGNKFIYRGIKEESINLRRQRGHLKAKQTNTSTFLLLFLSNLDDSLFFFGSNLLHTNLEGFETIYCMDISWFWEHQLYLALKCWIEVYIKSVIYITNLITNMFISFTNN